MTGLVQVERGGACERTFGRFLFVLLMMLVMFVPGWALSMADEAGSEEQPTVAEGDEMTRRLRDLEDLVAALRAELDTLRQSAGASASLEELERKIDALTQDIERLRIGKAAIPVADASVNGFGPAASKVYAIDKGVSIGGYGEMVYQDFDDTRDGGSPSGKTDTLDFVRAVFYFGYKFNDRWLFNSEIEFEHAIAGEGKEGEVAVEFAYLDFKATSNFGARGGLLLIPTGYLNELHEPPIFLGSLRPDVERYIIPTTWRENGAGVYGDFGPVSYKAYIVASLDALGFTPSGGIRGGRQGGSESKAEDFAITARLDYTPVPGLLLGTSVFSGGVGQGTPGLENAAITQWEAHANWNWRGLHLRALYAQNIVSDAAAIGQAIDAMPGSTSPTVIGERQVGWYGEVAWDVLSLSRATDQELSPFVRYESFNTQEQVAQGQVADPANDHRVRTFGIHYKPIANVVIKVDVRNNSNGAVIPTDRAIDQMNVALGYLF